MTIRSNRWWQRLLMGLVLCSALWGVPAHEAAAAVTCSANMSDPTFTNVDLVSGGTYSSTATLNYSCSNSDNGTRYVRLCFNIGDGSGSPTHTDWKPRAMLDTLTSNNKLTYQLYQGASPTTIWGSANNANVPLPFSVFITIAARVNSSTPRVYTGSTSMRAELSTGQAAVLPGDYTSSFSGGHTRFDYDYDSNSGQVAANCESMVGTNSGTFPFTVRASVAKACFVNANPLDFGSVDGVPSSGNIDAQSTITVTCSKNTAYSVALLPSNGSTTGNGSMAAQNTAPVTGNTDAIPYRLFRNSGRNQAWGNQIGTNTVAVTAASATANPTQTFTVYGRVPGLAAVQPDNYKDVVTVSVGY